MIKQHLARYNDQQILQACYEAYERSFIDQNRLQNQKNLDHILTGAGKYLGLLKEALLKELQGAELSGSPKYLTDFLGKLQRDASNVQAGLKAKAKAMHDELVKQKTE